MMKGRYARMKTQVRMKTSSWVVGLSIARKDPVAALGILKGRSNVC